MDPPMMKWWAVVAVLVTFVRIADAAEPGHPLTLNLQMTCDARVSPDVLEQSQNEVTRIFDEAGLTVRWTDTTPRFTVHIVAQVLGYRTAGSPVMGVALRNTNGSTAQVFFKQVQDFARVHRVELGSVLGYVIAHEIGHLLLPGNAHSPTGLMQAQWDKALVHNAARGSLTFTEGQAARIRASR
jgi:hypothetical protein